MKPRSDDERKYLESLLKKYSNTKDTFNKDIRKENSTFKIK